MLILRTCKSDMTAHGGFLWPTSGPVECPDWNPSPVCGGGLHGLPWGEGNGSLLSSDDDAKWLVVEADDSSVLTGDGELTGKCKFPRGNVVYCGERDGAIAYLRENGADGKAIVFNAVTAGFYGQASAGYKGQASAGSYGQASAGYKGQASAGYKGQASAGDGGVIVITWYDSNDRRRVAVGYPGEDGILPNTHYTVDENGKLVVIEPVVDHA